MLVFIALEGSGLDGRGCCYSRESAWNGSAPFLFVAEMLWPCGVGYRWKDPELALEGEAGTESLYD